MQELEDAERQLEERRVQEQALAAELRETELRLLESQQRTAEALERAAERLEDVESRAAEAEARVARAERLAKLKSDEIERGQRLRELLDRISEAEERATESEQRAQGRSSTTSSIRGVRGDSKAAETRGGALRAGAPSLPEPERRARTRAGTRAGARTRAGAGARAGARRPRARTRARHARAGVGAPNRSLQPERSSRSPSPSRQPSCRPERSRPPSRRTGSGQTDLNSATYDDLRGLGLSVTQTGRVLAFREREGSFKSLDELDSIAGFPRGFLDDLKTKLVELRARG